jgi:hypothetical protein
MLSVLEKLDEHIYQRLHQSLLEKKRNTIRITTKSMEQRIDAFTLSI